MSEQIKILGVRPDSFADLFYFFSKASCSAQVAILWLVAVIRTELVVFIKFKSFFWEKTFKTFHVFMRHGRAAMQQKNFDAGIIAKPFCPDFKISNRCFNGNHFDTGKLNTAVAVIKIFGYRHITITVLFRWCFAAK